MNARPPLSFWQIWNMAFGFLGIQFGWALQMANMSAIYEYLGADAHQIPMLWLAAPLTGLLVQPIIGHMSDRTWNRLGRRRPYFLAGALLASFALIAMPHSSTLWMAAGLLWIMDASINISMEPFRAFVADLLPPEQRTRGYAMQALFIGLGAVIASMLPWLLYGLFPPGREGVVAGRAIPLAVRLAFYVGAIAFLTAVLWTIFTTREHPPEDMEAFRRMKAEKTGFRAAAVEIFHDFLAMPLTMRRLAWVQIFTWLGFFCMWLYFGVAVARNIFGGTPGTPEYDQGIAWAGNCFAMYSAVCFAFSFALPPLAKRLGRRLTHALCLLSGAAGLTSVAAIDDKYVLLLPMIGVGIAWASTLAMPYAILAGSLPPGKTGIYMGIFNFFIVIPEILAALGFGTLLERLLTDESTLVMHLGGDNRLAVVVIGGLSLAVAAALCTIVVEPEGYPMRPTEPALSSEERAG
ncbi:MAG TPA: MFS transporter [Methylomirabilota bacterium]|nr:MFS transporter [Methylomirabilota bacterium]